MNSPVKSVKGNPARTRGISIKVRISVAPARCRLRCKAPLLFQKVQGTAGLGQMSDFHRTHLIALRLFGSLRLPGQVRV
jgi:hypothetical protein